MAAVDKAGLQKIYARLGEAALASLLRDFYARMSRDVMVGFFFDGKDLAHIAEQQLRFVLRAMDAVSSYAGKSPSAAHLELPPILAGHFDRRLRILEETLREHGLTEAEIQVWIGFEEAFRNVIVK